MLNSVFTVKNEEANFRLDVFLTKQSSEHSRSFFQKLIHNKKVKVNKNTVGVSYKVKLNDKVEVKTPSLKPQKIVPQEHDLDVIFEDKDIIAINKPAGIVVHPGAGRKQDTLANFLVHYCGKNLAKDTVRPGIVHRLDKDTSGVILVAKTDKVRAGLFEQFAARKVKKIYIALVDGIIKDQVGEINAPLARDPIDRQKISVMYTNKARHARTRFEVIQYLKFGEFNCTLLKVNILTGRTHQIRVHLRAIGHPVVGDQVYGQKSINKYFRDKLGLQRQFLHAKEITFTHPSKKEMTLTASLPKNLDKIIKQ